MELNRLLTDEDAVSSTIGVVLMVAVTVILAAAVGSFALGIAGESAKKTPSAAIEIDWGVQISGGTAYDTVDITVLGGDSLQSKFVTVAKGDGTVLWEAGTANAPYSTYASKNWDSPKIQSGDTLGLQEGNTGDLTQGNTVKVIWNNGEKSQVLGSGTLN